MSEFPPPDPRIDQRAGLWTSEFCLALGCLASGVWLVAKGREDLGVWLIGLATGGHQVSRAWVKGKVANG